MKKENPTLSPIFKEIINAWQINEKIPTSDFNDSILKVIPSLETILNINKSYIHIMDLASMNFAYVSDSIQNILGYSLATWKNASATIVMDIFHPEEVEIGNKILGIINQHALQQNREQRPTFRYTTNFRMKHADGRYIKLLNQLVFLASTDKGAPHMMFSFATEISQLPQVDGSICIISHYDNSSEQYETIYSSIFDNTGKEVLSSRECDILILISNGLSNKKIAEKLDISEYTVNDHRKNMLEKTNTSNICELFAFAIKRGII